MPTCVCIATAIATWALALQSDQVFSRIIRNLGYACFAFNLVVTIGVTSGIAYRLWRAGRVVSGFTGHNAYKTAMYTVIESGALYTASYVVQTILFISRSLAGTMAIDVGLQIAVGTLRVFLFLVSHSSRPWYLFFSSLVSALA